MRYRSLVVVLMAVFLAAPALAQEEEQDRQRSLSCTMTEQSNGGMAMSCLPQPEPEHDIRIDAVRSTSYSIAIEVTALQRSIERLALRLTISCDSDVQPAADRNVVRPHPGRDVWRTHRST